MIRRVLLAVAIALVAHVPAGAQGAVRSTVPRALSDADFWAMFVTMSEPSGTFPSENFVSNETGFQLPIRVLQQTTRPGAVYLGVGPEQNYTYIANLRPSMAFIVDIRRQNAMLHLMYKALFEMSPTRVDFVANLFARRLTKVDASTSASRLFEVALAAPLNPVAVKGIPDSILGILMRRHRFDLSVEDQATIRRVCDVFRTAGPRVNYSWRSGIRPAGSAAVFASFASLQTLTNGDSTNMAFLGSEAAYQRIRTLHRANLIVPIVGDFAGPKALRAVGAWLRERRATVQAFYLSNVEQYLFQEPAKAERFYASVATLPLDSTSTFIRSVHPMSGRGATMGGVRVVARSSVTTTWVMVDSAGKRVRRQVTTIDDSPITAAQKETERRLTLERAMTGMRPSSVSGLLTSGIASITATLRALGDGTIKSYEGIVAATRSSGW